MNSRNCPHPHFGLTSNRPQSQLFNRHHWMASEVSPFFLFFSWLALIYTPCSKTELPWPCLMPSLTRICHVWSCSLSRTFAWCHSHRSLEADQGASILSRSRRSLGRRWADLYGSFFCPWGRKKMFMPKTCVLYIYMYTYRIYHLSFKPSELNIRGIGFYIGKHETFELKDLKPPMAGKKKCCLGWIFWDVSTQPA